MLWVTDDRTDFRNHKRKKFHPLRTVIQIFRRKRKPLIKEDDDSNMSTLKSRSTSELLVADDEERNRSNANSSHLGAGLSMSHDSVFNPEHNDESNIRTAQSIQNLAMQKELLDRFQPQRDSDEDDIGLPYSPCTSPTTAEVLQQGLREASVKSHSVCSDGSLLSMGSSENDEDSSGALLLCHPHFSSDRRSEQEVDVEEGASFPLSHKAAHHKISVRPKRTHAVGRHRKLQQLTVASLPATPEDIEESQGNSPDHSWPTIGEGAYSSDSISRTSSAMSISDSTSSMSAGTSPTPKKIMTSFSPETIDIPHRSQQSIVERKIKQKNENISRRRTVSESPSKDYDITGKDAVPTEARAHSLTVTELQELSKMPWVEMLKDTKATSSEIKDFRSLSPVRRDVQKPSSNSESLKTSSFSILSKSEEENLNKAQQLSAEQPLQISTSSDAPSGDNASNAKRISTVIISDKEKQTHASEYIQRDLSYRLAVEEGEKEEIVHKNASKVKQKSVKEPSSGLFSFSSKSKKVDDLSKGKGKDNKEQKIKKDDKKDIQKEIKAKKEDKIKDVKDKKDDGDSPFFSRIWNSRRNSKRKKEKSEPESESSQKSSAAIETRRQSYKTTSDGSPISTVDVKAMIQNLSAHSYSTSNVKEIDKKSPKPLPKRSFYRKSEALSSTESGNFSKSLESISGPQSLDSAININYDIQTSGNKLSGSMPRLNASCKKNDKAGNEVTGINSSDNVMMIEGEIVRLRKKLFSNEDAKPRRPLLSEKSNKLSKTEKKEKSEQRSFSSWHGKKESDSSANQKLTIQDSKMAPSETRKFSRSSIFHKTVEKKTLQQGINSDNKPINVPEDKNKISTDNGIANRLSGFWSSTISNIKSDIFHKEESDQISRTNSIKNIAASSFIGAGDSKDLVESCNEPKISNINQGLQEASSTEKVPEFLRIQLNRVKLPNDMQMDSNSSTLQLEKQTMKSPVKQHFIESDQTPQKEHVESNISIKIATDNKKKSVFNEAGGKLISGQTDKKGDIEVSSKEEPLQEKSSNLVANQTVNKKDGLKGSADAEISAKTNPLPKRENENESELMKVFHRRSLKIKDKDSSKDSTSKSPSQKETNGKPEDKKQSDEAISKVLVLEPNEENAKFISSMENTQSGKSESDVVSHKAGMADKRSISLCQEPLPSPRMRTNTSPNVTLIASSSDVSKCIDKSENDVPEWRKIAQQRREQREQRERKVVTGNGHSDSTLILQSAPKHSGRSKVLDMVSTFQKLQVS